MTASHVWGVGNTTFLWCYGALCALILAGIWLRRMSLLNVRDDTARPPSCDAYGLAMLNGGPQLAITIAAAELHRVGSLARGSSGKLVKVTQRPDRVADGTGELEDEVFDAVLRNPGVSARTLRRELDGCAPIRRIASTLIQAGLLLDDRGRAQLNRLWVWTLPLLVLGIARLTAVGGDDEAATSLTVMLLALTAVAMWLAMQRPRATARGRRLLKTERAGHRTHGRMPSRTEIPAAVALYGAGVLWVADPGIAFAWDVPRERGTTWTGDAGGCGAGFGGAGSCGSGGGGGG
jgi:uncharacterized protein (TIGR04222 family)